MDPICLAVRAASAATVVVAGLAALAGAAVAAGFCSEPPLPHCLGAVGGFADEAERGRCQYELDSYLADLERQANCVLQLAEEEARRRVEAGRREAEAVRGEGREALLRFECRARGNIC